VAMELAGERHTEAAALDLQPDAGVRMGADPARAALRIAHPGGRVRHRARRRVVVAGASSAAAAPDRPRSAAELQVAARAALSVASTAVDTDSAQHAVERRSTEGVLRRDGVHDAADGV